VADKKLILMASAIILLLLGHDFDHFVRGDFGLQLTARSALVVAILALQYAILGFGLYFCVKNKVGPLFWEIVAGAGLVLAFVAHFSPYSEQTPPVIYRAYATPAAGALAVAVLALLMLTLLATFAYAQSLRATGGRHRAK